jgi:hypothetical protein
MILLVASGPSRNAAFRIELIQRLMKGDQRVRGGRKPELTITLKARPLRMQIET